MMISFRPVCPHPRAQAQEFRSVQRSKNKRAENTPTAVYLLRMWKIIMSVMITATMCTKHVAAVQRQ